jgi:hypothetical protein
MLIWVIFLWYPLGTRHTRIAVSGQKPNNPTPELRSKNFSLPGRVVVSNLILNCGQENLTY